jgi:hypothetical protein
MWVPILCSLASHADEAHNAKRAAYILQRHWRQQECLSKLHGHE